MCPSIFHYSPSIIGHLAIVSATDHTEWPEPLSGEAPDHVVLKTRVCREGRPAVHRAHVGHVTTCLLLVPDVVSVLQPGGELRAAVHAHDGRLLVVPLVPALTSAVGFVQTESLN